MENEELGTVSDEGLRAAGEVPPDDSDEGGDEQPALLPRPCIEEFVAANYKAEDYDTYFGKEYGPGWSDPTWTKEKAEQARAMGELLRNLPEVLHVRSKVRHVSTRTVRTRQPTRHRFKQYLFSDPTLRLVRKRPVRITAGQLLHNIEELIQKEDAGILTVHLLDGRQLDLKQLRSGRVGAATPAPTPAIYNRRLDSIAHDIPSGQALPQYVDGTFPGDPAAVRAVNRMTAEKQHEAERQGSNDPPADAEAETPVETPVEGESQVDTSDDAAETEEPITEDGEDQVGEQDEMPEDALTETVSDVADIETSAPAFETTGVDPAASRSGKRGGKGRRK